MQQGVWTNEEEERVSWEEGGECGPTCAMPRMTPKMFFGNQSLASRHKFCSKAKLVLESKAESSKMCYYAFWELLHEAQQVVDYEISGETLRFIRI